jgi:hypothetical protein
VRSVHHGFIALPGTPLADKPHAQARTAVAPCDWRATARASPPDTGIAPPDLTNVPLPSSAHCNFAVSYHLLGIGRDYRELGADYVTTLDSDRVTQHHVQHLSQLGYAVTLMPKEAA